MPRITDVDAPLFEGAGGPLHDWDVTGAHVSELPATVIDKLISADGVRREPDDGEIRLSRARLAAAYRDDLRRFIFI